MHAEVHAQAVDVPPLLTGGGGEGGGGRGGGGERSGGGEEGIAWAQYA